MIKEVGNSIMFLSSESVGFLPSAFKLCGDSPPTLGSWVMKKDLNVGRIDAADT